MNINYSKIAFLAALFALTVVILGAYTRLSNAGLGCPDWPGCYGHLTVPQTATDIQNAQIKFPGQVVQAPKAWKEMVHRYFAGTLALLIFVLAVWAIKLRMHYRRQPIVLPALLLLLVIFQATLGMWTVTWKVLPIIVSIHLLCGLAITALLWHLMLITKPKRQTIIQALYFKKWVLFGLLLLVLQIFLGAWTSTTYSALACHDFPFCHGMLFPNLELRQAFQIFQPIGINYEGGVLETPLRMTIQMMHRYGAFITSIYLYVLAIRIIFSSKTAGLRGITGLLILVLTLQLLLGIGNVLLGLPMWTAVLHNAVAVVLLLIVVTLLYRLKSPVQLLF